MTHENIQLITITENGHSEIKGLSIEKGYEDKTLRYLCRKYPEIDQIFIKNNGKLVKMTDVNGLLIDGDTLLAVAPATSGRVEIPEGIRYVKYGAFAGCSHIKSLYVPASVDRLGALFPRGQLIPGDLLEHLDDCTRLREIEIDENNPWYSFHDNALWYKGELGRLYGGEQETVKLWEITG